MNLKEILLDFKAGLKPALIAISCGAIIAFSIDYFNVTDKQFLLGLSVALAIYFTVLVGGLRRLR